MPININIVKEIDKFLIDRAKKNDRDYSHFHPSEWDGCHRKIAYAYYESQGLLTIDHSALKIDARMERIFDNGHFVHSRFGVYLRNIGGLKGRWICKNIGAHRRRPQIFGVEEKLGVLQPEKCECGCNQFEYVEVGLSDPETMWAGHVDAIVDLRHWPTAVKGIDKETVAEEDAHMVVDYKSIMSFAYGKLDQPKPEHITQMQIYLYLSGLKVGKFLYENKNDQNIKEYLVVRDDKFLEVKREEALLLKYRVSHKNQDGRRVLPDRAYSSKGHQECLRCKFRGHCWRI
jgi:hypothetical protein